MQAREITLTGARALLSLVITLASTAAHAATDITQLLAGDAPQVQIAGEKLWSTPFLRELYAAPDDAPRWTSAQLTVLRKAIADSAADGLDPRDFLIERMTDIETLPTAMRELLAGEALARLAFTLRFGKCNPEALDPDWNYSRSFGPTDPTVWLRESIASDKLAARLAALRPTDNYYRALIKALADYRARATAGEWPKVATGPTLKPGMDDARITQLRARLTASGEWAADKSDGDVTHFDDRLVAAVRGLQGRQGLEIDGAVGRGTLAALNVTVAERIAQLRVNLERIRWVFRDVEDEAISVNIAAFEAVYIDHGKRRWSGRVIVGKPFRQTPIFKDRLSYVELNPSWTVPPTILREDILPKLRQNPDYLKTKKLKLIDFDGRPIDASALDWRKIKGAGFPYFLRQEAGPDNPLGRVAFMFPNVHSVYLHDTPTRGLFSLAERAFSSGCIRIENPLALAQAVLKDDTHWNQQALQNAIAGGVNQHINLPRKISIMLLYLTAFPGEDGEVQFRRDVYARDAAVLSALDAPLRWTPPKDFKMPGRRGI